MTDTVFVCIKDSILSNEFIGLIYKAEETNSYWYLSFNEVLTLVLATAAFIIAYKQFRHEMQLSRTQSQEAIDNEKKVKQREWYLTVIVYPRIESINNFYKDYIENLINNIGGIRNNILLSDLDMLTFQSTIIADSKERIYSFFDHLEFLVRPFDEELSEKIADKAMDLEDSTSKLIEYYLKNQDESLEEIRRLILLNKIDVISLLYDKSKEI